MFTLRRFALAVITMPFVGVLYGALYFGLSLVANSYASLGLYLSNLTALAFGWIIAVTFSKQILDFINRFGE